MKRDRLPLLWLCSLSLAGICLSAAQAGENQPDPKEVKAVLDKAVAYLKSAQEADGSFAPKLAGPGVGALVAAGLLRNGISPDEPVVAKTLKFLESKVKKDGGIYDKFLANYTTSVAVMALKEGNNKGQYDKILKDAAKFLKEIQTDEPESTSNDVAFGGFSYQGKGAPDASNTNFAVEALLASGLPKDDPAIQKALKFLSRCQNLPKKEANDQPFATKATEEDKGGFTYNPTNPDKSEYKTAAGGLRSLGSMTYGGLKSFLYAGVKKDDPRVQAAVDWIKRHYTLEENPGLGKGGLYYYYHTFAKAMDALGDEVFEDAKGTKHNWRNELFQTLKAKQLPNGSWANTDKRFGETSPELATAFAVLSLSYCHAKAK